MCQDYLLYYLDNLPIELNEIYIFPKGGFTEGLLRAQEPGEVWLITLEDFYR